METENLVQFRQDAPGSWEEALESFLLWKRATGISKRTIYDYTVHVNLFFKRFASSFEDLPRLKHNFLCHMGQDDIAPATFNIRLKYLRGYFQWCVDEGIILRSPADGLKKRREEPRVVRMDVDNMKRLLALPNKKSFVGVRDYALMLLTLDTGIRPSESLALSREDVNLSSLEISIKAAISKTRKGRTLFIVPETAAAIRKLLASHLKEWFPATIFCTYEGKKMDTPAWALRLRKYGKLMGMRLSPYDLRHVHALQFLRNGGNLIALQREMGHSDLTMTKRYLAITDEDVREAHCKASPVGGLINRRTR
ncbi:MAG: tyrosine-type recombinase/integrase [Thermovirgaceae bacterium]|nr:tyrosine-type recombinase/integrase [Thermovirgaceae bacterium]